MPSRLLSMALCGALLAFPCTAFATEDGGEAGAGADAATEASGKDAAPLTDSGSPAEDDAGDGAMPASGNVPVVACDGALCDTTQGRPVCDVAAPLGHSTAGWRSLLGLVLPLGLAVLRRSRPGASRPGRGGGAC